MSREYTIGMQGQNTLQRHLRGSKGQRIYINYRGKTFLMNFWEKENLENLL